MVIDYRKEHGWKACSGRNVVLETDDDYVMDKKMTDEEVLGKVGMKRQNY